MPAVQVQAWAAVGCPSWLLSGQGAASVEELVSLHDVQAYHRTRCQNSRRLLPRPLLPWSGRRCGVGRLAAQPPLRGARRESAFRRPRPVAPESLGRLEETSERTRGKGAFWLPAWRCAAPWPGSPVGLSAWPMLTPPLQPAPALRRCDSVHGWCPGLKPRPPHSCVWAASAAWVRQEGSYLVDPASSHMLVSKIKPCMSKYKLLYTVKLRMAH